MSRKISNILVICAMVVIFPLLIIGTTFAAYYSINATAKVSFYVANANSTEQSTANEAGAKMGVVYNNKETTEDFEITNSHVKQITLRPTGKGYTFVGWFNGTAEEYENAVEKEYIEVENGVLTATLSKYKNLLAIYNLDQYAVSYNYNADPENTADYTTATPAGGATQYKYGATLPTLNYTHYTFNGWNVNGKLYKKATFDKAETYELKATTENGAWTEHAKVTVTYVVGETETQEVIGYVADNPALKDAAAASTSPATTGKRWAWVDSNNNEVKTASTNIRVTLKEVALTYKVNVVNGEDIAYTGASKTFAYGAVNALADLYNNANFTTAYAFWKIGSFTYNGTDYTSAAALQTAIQNANTITDAEVSVTANVKKYFTNVTVTAVELGSYNGVDFSGKVYNGEHAEVQGEPIASKASTTEVVEWLKLGGQYYSDAAAQNEIFLSRIHVETAGSEYACEVDPEVETINDLIAVLYAEIELDDADTLAITKIILQYE